MSSGTIKTGGPAFPQHLAFNPHSGESAIAVEHYNEAEGMTLRDWFAGKALQGLASNPMGAEAFTQCGENVSISALAYHLAGSMIEARNRTDATDRTDAEHDSIELVRKERNDLLAIVEQISLSIHPPNPNDDGKPCICSQCELAIQARAVLGMVAGRSE